MGDSISLVRSFIIAARKTRQRGRGSGVPCGRKVALSLRQGRCIADFTLTFRLYEREQTASSFVDGFGGCVPFLSRRRVSCDGIEIVRVTCCSP